MVAREAKRLLDECGDDISIGVITFYSAQRDAIFRELAQAGITYRDAATKEWLVADAYKKTSNHEERFRVGTVDAFQGKEFDVVLLSCVRSFQPNRSGRAAASEGDDRELQLNRQFGFLRLPNRMNVAMSRQRQMLICVGDAALASNPDAQEAVPALAAFYQLCGGEHGCIR